MSTSKMSGSMDESFRLNIIQGSKARLRILIGYVLGGLVRKSRSSQGGTPDVCKVVRLLIFLTTKLCSQARKFAGLVV